ncbi:hypothetical protein [Clostridium formicaceticum]|nr:hypothetical protein [Clostridium formicaceticum]
MTNTALKPWVANVALSISKLSPDVIYKIAKGIKREMIGYEQ